MQKSISILLIFFLGYTASQAQDTPSIALDHVALSVEDVDKAAAFYKDVIGLNEITNKTKQEGIRWFSLGEGKELHLISVIKDPVVRNRAGHFALKTASFDMLIEILKEKGIGYENWPGTPNTIQVRADGIRQIFLKDPDGNWIEVNEVGRSK